MTKEDTVDYWTQTVLSKKLLLHTWCPETVLILAFKKLRYDSQNAKYILMYMLPVSGFWYSHYIMHILPSNLFQNISIISQKEQLFLTPPLHVNEMSL